MQAARKTLRMQKKAEMARGYLKEVRAQGRREEVIPQERQEMAQERQGIARRRLEMARGRLAGCRRELPEQMIARRRQTDSRREKMTACRAIRRWTVQKKTVEKRRAEMAA